MWIKVTYAFNKKEVHIDISKAWRIKAKPHGSVIYFDNHMKEEREIAVKETPAELIDLVNHERIRNT